MLIRSVITRHHHRRLIPAYCHLHRATTTASPSFNPVSIRVVYYSAMSTPTTSPSFSTAVTDTVAALEALRPLLTPDPDPDSDPGSDGGSRGGRWTLSANGHGIERSFKFATFKKTWEFMNAVAQEAKKNNHHPEWSNIYNTTFIRWTTHHPKGLSNKDIDMAATCNLLATRFDELLDTPNTSTNTDLSRLADSALVSSGNCCGPKKT